MEPVLMCGVGSFVWTGVSSLKAVQERVRRLITEFGSDSCRLLLRFYTDKFDKFVSQAVDVEFAFELA